MFLIFVYETYIPRPQAINCERHTGKSFGWFIDPGVQVHLSFFIVRGNPLQKIFRDFAAETINY